MVKLQLMGHKERAHLFMDAYLLINANILLFWTEFKKVLEWLCDCPVRSLPILPLVFTSGRAVRHEEPLKSSPVYVPPYVCVLHHWWEKDILNTLHYHVLYVPWPDLTKTHRGLCCNDLSFAKRHPGEHCLFIMYTTLSGSMISTIYIIDHPLVHRCLKPALHISCWLLRFWVSQVPVFMMAIRLEERQKEHWTIIIDCWCRLSSRSQIFGKPSSTLTLN